VRVVRVARVVRRARVVKVATTTAYINNWVEELINITIRKLELI
jgi:hypothetical protein